jgi:hypothetical protein
VKQDPLKLEVGAATHESTVRAKLDVVNLKDLSSTSLSFGYERTRKVGGRNRVGRRGRSRESG